MYITPTKDQLAEWQHSGVDGSAVSQEDIDESFRRIIEAEQNLLDEDEFGLAEPITPHAAFLLAATTVRMASQANAPLLPAPTVREQYVANSESSPRTETCLYYQLHHAATTSLQGILNLFKPGGRQVSAQSAAKDDVIVRTVRWTRRAFTSGSNYVDQRSDTIEVANSLAGGSWPVSTRTLHTVAWDIATWSVRRKRTINDSNVITHQEISKRWPGQSYATACPGDMQRRKGELIALAKRYFASITGSTSKPKPKPEKLAPGKLRITTWPRATYSLAAGDTPTSVAKKFGMSVKRLRNLNGKPNGWDRWPVGLEVTVALDYADESYQYLNEGNEHTLATAQVQRRLKAAYPSYSGAVKINGIYDNATFKAVAEFQRRSPGLGASGRVDRNTWNALFPRKTTPPKATTHTIVKGDTLWSISRKHGTTVPELKKLNPGIDAQALQIGAQVRVK